MLQKRIKFINPKNLPINELYFQVKDNGIHRDIPALSEHWSDSKHIFTKYIPLPIQDGQLLKTGAILDEWRKEAEIFNEDMQYLLELQHCQFWLTLIYNKESIEAIVSFLQEATPFYINLKEIIDSITMNTYKNILSNVLRIICRIITNKESDSEWMTKEYFCKLIYTKFLISIPMLFDLIIACGQSNLVILKKIFDTVFKIEPRYYDDLKVSLKFIQNSFKSIQGTIENNGDSSDLALYILDCALTLNILLEICPKARNISNEIDMSVQISNFYDSAIPILYKNIFAIDPSSISLNFVNRARLAFITSYNLLISVHIEQILKNPEESVLPSEEYIKILTESLADHTFVSDYENIFPVENDIDIMKQACKDLDLFKIDFILNGYSKEEKRTINNIIQNEEIVQNGKNKIYKNDIPQIKASLASAERNMDNEILNVRDILPHLGDGFIRKLLSRYENPELAISAVLEGNLPPDLITADQTEIFIPTDPQDILFNQTGIQRYNDYDGDKYDIMARDNPECIIKVGKGLPGQPKNMKELLNDKSHVNMLRDRYQEYSLVTENNEYEDEYDDSYDAMAESESKSQRKHNINKNEIVDEIEEAEESSADESTIDATNKNNNGSNRDIFCENPEITRARYEAKRQAKYARFAPRTNNIDLSGKPKGQGQDQKTLQERQKKNTHKSDRANHNRRAGAAFKRSRGMIPS